METEKERAEREMADKLNAEAAERFKLDEGSRKVTQEEAEAAERVFFEDDEVIKLRDGRSYRIPPCSLKDARKLMKLLKTVNVDAIILNFIPTEDEEQDEKRQQELFEILAMAFKNYPRIVSKNPDDGSCIINRDYLDEHVDLITARKIIDTLIGLNGLKKVERNEGEPVEGIEIRDVDTNEPLHWGDIFFILHKHCGLNKWEIWDYTLPQVAELCKAASRYIQFEVEMATAPLRMFGGGGGGERSADADGSFTRARTFNDGDYIEIDDDGIALLANALGG